MSVLRNLGAAQILSVHGFDKEAAELILSSFVPTDKVAAEGPNPFSHMSDQELLHLISLLPPETKQLILGELQQQLQGAK